MHEWRARPHVPTGLWLKARSRPPRSQLAALAPLLWPVAGWHGEKGVREEALSCARGLLEAKPGAYSGPF
jgi:hypothetical protein